MSAKEDPKKRHSRPKSVRNDPIIIHPGLCTPGILSISVSPSPIPAGAFATISVTLRNNTNSNCEVNLTYSDSSVFVAPVPSQIVFAQGTTTGAVQAQAVNNLSANTTVTITATGSGAGNNQSTQVTVNQGAQPAGVVAAFNPSAMLLSPNPIVLAIQQDPVAHIYCHIFGTPAQTTARLQIRSSQPEIVPDFHIELRNLTPFANFDRRITLPVNVQLPDGSQVSPNTTVTVIGFAEGDQEVDAFGNPHPANCIRAVLHFQ